LHGPKEDPVVLLSEGFFQSHISMCARKEIEVEAKGEEKSDGHQGMAMP